MNTVARRLSVWACAAGMAFFAAACRNTAIGLKRDAEDNERRPRSKPARPPTRRLKQQRRRHAQRLTRPRLARKQST
jgi:hypothetical protein